MNVRAAKLVLLVVALSGCETTSTSLIPKGDHSLGPYAINTPIEWNRLPGAVERWTVDGETLQALVFVSGVEEGEPLFNPELKEQVGGYSLGMTTGELAELFIQSFSRNSGAIAAEIERLGPARFGPWEGFRLEMTYESADGLSERAVVLGAIVEKKLEIVMYRGARDYYFEKYLPSVEQILASIEPAPTPVVAQ